MNHKHHKITRNETNDANAFIINTLANVEREKRCYNCCEPNVLEGTDI